MLTQSELLTLSERTRIKRIILREWTTHGDCIEHLNFYSINGKDFEVDLENSQMHYHSPSIDFDNYRGDEERRKSEHARKYDEEVARLREITKPLKIKNVESYNLK